MSKFLVSTILFIINNTVASCIDGYNITVKTDVSVQHGCVVMMSSRKALIGVNWHININQIKSFWYDLIQHII